MFLKIHLFFFWYCQICFKNRPKFQRKSTYLNTKHMVKQIKINFSRAISVKNDLRKLEGICFFFAIANFSKCGFEGGGFVRGGGGIYSEVCRWTYQRFGMSFEVKLIHSQRWIDLPISSAQKIDFRKKSF